LSKLKKNRVPIKCETKRNENETKRNQRNENEIKRKPTKAKRNQRKQNEIDWYEENGRKKIKDKTK
jgi:hypothetical protein